MKPKVNWPYLIFCTVSWAILMCGIGASVTLPALHAINHGLPIPGGWSLPAIIAIDIVCVFTFLLIPYKAYVDLNTIITDKFIQQPNPFRLARIDWTEVQGVKVDRFAIQIQGKKHKITLTIFAYAKPAELVNKVLTIAKEHSIPTEIIFHHNV